MGSLLGRIIASFAISTISLVVASTSPTWVVYGQGLLSRIILGAGIGAGLGITLRGKAWLRFVVAGAVGFGRGYHRVDHSLSGNGWIVRRSRLGLGSGAQPARSRYSSRDRTSARLNQGVRWGAKMNLHKRQCFSQWFLVLVVLALSACSSGQMAPTPSAGIDGPTPACQSRPLPSGVTADHIPGQALPTVVAASTVILIGQAQPSTEIVNLARGNSFAIGQVYTVTVQRYLKGSGPSWLKVIQSEGELDRPAACVTAQKAIRANQGKIFMGSSLANDPCKYQISRSGLVGYLLAAGSGSFRFSPSLMAYRFCIVDTYKIPLAAVAVPLMGLPNEHSLRRRLSLVAAKT